MACAMGYSFLGALEARPSARCAGLNEMRARFFERAKSATCRAPTGKKASVKPAALKPAALHLNLSRGIIRGGYLQ